MVACQQTRAIFVVLLQLVCFQICLTAECNYVISSDLESGWFTSPNHPKNYPNQAKCSWLIHSKNPIIISITQFHTESGYDLLKIYDGPTTLSSLLLVVSGNDIPPALVSTTNQILITFTSDYSSSYSGFNATYSSYRCQHFLSSESGWFSSPNKSPNSLDDINCRWLIQTKRPITFSFSQFHLKKSKDWLMIYDGPTESSDLLFKGSSKSEIPSLIETTTNQALVVFWSDKSGPYSRFNATYEPYRCQYILSSESGLFKSPKLTKQYSAANCSWLINATQPISLSFSQFQIENYQDSVKVYDGSSTSVELFRAIRYQNIPSFIISSTNQMLITFYSEGLSTSKSYSGFVASYEPSRCQEILSDSGWFTSPNYPLNHPENSRNCWIIKATNPIMISFSFHPEEYYDWLTPCRCEAISLTDSGWFTTPNYPSNYSDNLRLCWSINSTKPIKLSFNRVDVEENRGVLRVYDGLTTYQPHILFPNLPKITSMNSLIDNSIISNSNQMLVTFTSDESGSFSGFNATCESYRCHRILSSESGWFTSRDSWFDYAPKFNCSWLINATHPIILTFNDFFESVKEERLTIYDGPTTSSALLFNSSVTEPSLVSSTTNQMLIVFNSTQSRSFNLFNVTYYASECTHYLNSESGWFSSPNHSLNSTGDNNCRWYFNTEKPILFSFHHFRQGNDKDWLMIYDGPTESSDLLFKGSSKSEIPSFIETTTNLALVVFHRSDKSGPYSLRKMFTFLSRNKCTI